jgi:hypothetical protein
MNGALGGWKIGVMETAQSGAVFTVYNLANTTNAFPAGQLRPDILRDPQLSSGERSITRWFDTGAFAAPAFFTFGNSPRSALRGPSFIQTDLTIEKPFPIGERFKLDLRGEFYNLLNNTNFDPPGHTFGGPGFGVISSADVPRRIQLAARVSF